MQTNKFVGTSFLDRLHYLVIDRLQGNWAELARKAELMPSTIHQIKTGSEPKLSSLERICKALGASLDWLVSGEGEMLKASPITETATGKQTQKLAEMLEGLNEGQCLAISSIIEDKKRLNELEAVVMELKSKLEK